MRSRLLERDEDEDEEDEELERRSFLERRSLERSLRLRLSRWLLLEERRRRDDDLDLFRRLRELDLDLDRFLRLGDLELELDDRFLRSLAERERDLDRLRLINLKKNIYNSNDLFLSLLIIQIDK